MPFVEPCTDAVHITLAVVNVQMAVMCINFFPLVISQHMPMMLKELFS